MQSFRVVGSLLSASVPSAAYLVQSEKFSKLEQLLARKQWQTANQESFAILSNICGLTSDRTLKIGNLSCYNLHIIDSLWLKYSQGRFGFSVQQRVWRQICQDAIEIQNTQDQRWTAFCDRWGGTLSLTSSAFRLDIFQLVPKQSVRQRFTPQFSRGSIARWKAVDRAKSTPHTADRYVQSNISSAILPDPHSLQR
ncbi:MAG: hypothetical protein HC895_04315 [Leptolyngbyaceae cyanobacterium SM1_3_5]|nr:hypothetical protein [Leptolyngbyaceae cyanobacterium SM1_3_5]